MKEIYLVVIVYLLLAVRIYQHFFRHSHPLQDRWSSLLGAGWTSLVSSLIWPSLGALFIIQFIARPFLIPSGSMLETLQIGDRIIANRLVYFMSSPHRGDCVVFHPPENYQGEAEILIKRCVATAGDTVEIIDGTLYLNAEAQQEAYIEEDGSSQMQKVTVPQGHILCLGDNRNNSRDSRYYGSVPVANVLGRADLVFWPLNRLSSIDKLTEKVSDSE